MLDHSVLKSTFINASTIDIVYACLLAFVLGVAIAVTYIRTFSGLSYSQAFLQALILAPLLSAIAMQAVGDNVARGLGMMGAFSILRFRTEVKDTRDMMFIFSSLAAGMACGVYSYWIALIGISFFCVAVFILHKNPFNPKADYDAVLRFQLDNDPSLQTNVDHILQQHARRFSLISIRELAQGGRLDMSYQVKMREPASQNKIINDLGRVNTVRDLHFFMQDKAYEI